MATTDLTVKEATSLAIGGREGVKELAERIKLMLPSGTKYTTPEALAISQLAYMNDLDPFNGEVWGIKKDDKWYGVMVGVKGLRKAANRQAKREETVYWIETVQVASDKYGATKPGSLVFEAHLRDTVKVQAWGKSLNILTTAGVPYAEAVKMLGACPEVVGIGIADPSEFSKMGLGQRAKKRAESDALKQRFQVNFGQGVFSEGDKMDAATAAFAEESENTITGVVVDAEAQPQAPKKSEGELLKGLGYDAPAEPEEPEFSPAEVLTDAPAMSKEEADYLDACEIVSAQTGEKYGVIDSKKLGYVARNTGSQPEKRRAAEIILAWRTAHPQA